MQFLNSIKFYFFKEYWSIGMHAVAYATAQRWRRRSPHFPYLRRIARLLRIVSGYLLHCHMIQLLIVSYESYYSCISFTSHFLSFNICCDAEVSHLLARILMLASVFCNRYLNGTYIFGTTCAFTWMARGIDGDGWCCEAGSLLVRIFLIFSSPFWSLMDVLCCSKFE